MAETNISVISLNSTGTLASSLNLASSPLFFVQKLNELAASPLSVQYTELALFWFVLFCGLFFTCAIVTSIFGTFTTIGRNFVLTQNILSTFHAIISASLGLLVWWFTKPQCQLRQNDWVVLTVSSTAGYLICHAFTMTCLHVKGLRKAELALYIHHIFIITWLAIGIEYNAAIWFASTLLFNEASTPFVNYFEYLKAAGRKDSKAFMLNGVMLTLVFFICRVVYIPYSLYQFAVECEMCLESLHEVGYLALCGYVVLLLLNTFWFTKLLAGAINTIRGKRKKEV